MGLSDDKGIRGMSEVTRSCLWRVIRVTRVSLRAVVARLERARRIKEGREGEGEPARRRSQGGITDTPEMLTTEQRQLRAGSWHYNRRAAVCAVQGQICSALMSHDNTPKRFLIIYYASSQLN